MNTSHTVEHVVECYAGEIAYCKVVLVNRMLDSYLRGGSAEVPGEMTTNRG